MLGAMPVAPLSDHQPYRAAPDACAVSDVAEFAAVASPLERARLLCGHARHGDALLAALAYERREVSTEAGAAGPDRGVHRPKASQAPEGTAARWNALPTRARRPADPRHLVLSGKADRRGSPPFRACGVRHCIRPGWTSTGVTVGVRTGCAESVDDPRLVRHGRWGRR